MAVKEFEYEYNPVKMNKDGGEAERVIWTSKAFNIAVDAIKKGLPLKSNPFCGKNVQLLKPDLVYRRTQEEIEDYIKCREDPVYFASKCYLMTPEGLKPCILRDYQIEYLRMLQKNNFTILLSCRQAGKTLNMTSNIKVKFDKKISKFDEKLEKLHRYYIDDNTYELPIFELYNLYCKKTVIWKCKYHLYKLIYKLEYGLENRVKLNHEESKKIKEYYQKYFPSLTEEECEKIKKEKLEKEKKNKNTKILYKIISLLDFIDYHYVRKEHLIDNYKTIEEINLNNIKILTDTGYKELSALMISKPFEIYSIELENGYKLDCADEHIVFDKDFNEIYVKDLKIGDYIQTDDGSKKVISITVNKTKVSMCDTTVNDENHRFYSNGILSHNSTTTAIFCLWVILFNTDMSGLILSKSGPAGVDLLSKLKDMYLNLPYYLKAGTMKWNMHEIGFDNNSSISTEAFSPTAGLGKTINFLILDEFAWCPQNDVELFYQNVIPTVTTLPNAHVAIMSTQNGFNLFYKLYKGAIEKTNSYTPFKVDWNQVPQYNDKTKKWEKRTEKWKQKMIGILGSEEAFYYQYGTQFSASDFCLVSRECLSVLRDKSVLFENREDLDIILQKKDSLFWKPGFNFEELENGYFVILADLAEGGGGDSDSTVFNILQLIGKDKFEQIGYWKCNNLDLEHAALEYWLLASQLFDNDRCIFSIEWNTYGSIFYQYILNLNEDDYMKEATWRFNINKDGFDTSRIAQYKKGSEDDNIPGMNNSKRKTIPGIRFSANSKKSACALLKIEIERFNIIISDLITIGEIENFEDKNGNGSYKASYGHDDLIMTFCQIPMLKNTAKYKDFVEDFEINKTYQKKTSESKSEFDDISEIIGKIISVFSPTSSSINDTYEINNTNKNLYNF